MNLLGLASNEPFENALSCNKAVLVLEFVNLICDALIGTLISDSATVDIIAFWVKALDRDLVAPKS